MGQQEWHLSSCPLHVSGVGPDWRNRVCVIAFDDELAQGCYSQIKVMNELAIEEHKANELGNILDYLRLRPMARSWCLD
jgi:hypothetical protein